MKNSYISLGYRCNHKCVTCPLSFSDRQNNDTNPEVICKVLFELQNGDHVTISGGEPTLYPILYDVISECNERCISATILTNGSGFADKKYAEKMAEVCVNSNIDIVTAIYHCEAKINDAIVGIVGSFEKSIQGIENLLSYGYNVTIKIIISKYNYLDLENIVHFILNQFNDKVAIQFTSMDYSGRAYTNHDKYFVSFEDYQSYFEKALDLILYDKKRKVKVSIIEMPLCHLDPFYWRLFPQKNPLTNIYIAPNADSKNNTIFDLSNQCHTNYKTCQKCDARFLCHGAWQSAVDIGGEQLLCAIKSERH